MTRRIGVVTGTRAEYGLLYWLMKEIDADPDLELQLLVTGMHLAPEFGLTYTQIEADGFRIAAKVEMLLSSDTPVGIAKSTGLGTIGFADALDRLKPDILVVLGDRFEILSAVTAATMHRIPIAHIHGGESTEGAIDDAVRHAITKMSHLHFTTAEVYRNRVIQMGESPDRVFLVGVPGVEHLNRLPLMSREELEQDLDFPLQAPVLLVTYHPVTLEGSPEATVRELLAALDAFPECRVVFTMPNADAGGRCIVPMIEDFVAAHPERARSFVSLGQVRYLSLMKVCDVVLGNSSSGLLEAPTCGTPTVNIGNRQKGRLRPESVIDCAEDRDSIREALALALSPEIFEVAEKAAHLCGTGLPSRTMREILAMSPLDSILKKTFHTAQACD